MSLISLAEGASADHHVISGAIDPASNWWQCHGGACPRRGKAGIQQRALRADSNWIPGQARNDETHAVC
jgi:hypothetical protein